METIDVVVGRIGKAHGLRGDVTINVRTDEPERRFAAGSVLRVRGARGVGPTPVDRADGGEHALALVGAAGPLRGDPRPHRRRGRARAPAARRRPGRRVARGPRRVLRPPAGRARGVRPRRRRARRGHRPRARRPGPAAGPHARRPRHAGAVREGAGARGRRRRRPGRRSPTGPAWSRRSPRTT